MKLLIIIILTLVFETAYSQLTIRDTITFGSDKDYPPYEYLDEKGNPAGFNIDLMRAIAEEMGFAVKFKLGDWADIRKNLEIDGTVHISDMFYSEARDIHVDFAIPHEVMYDEIYIRAGTKGIVEEKDLVQKRVAVQKGSSLEDRLRSFHPSITRIPTTTEYEALLLLSKGGCDAAIVSRTTGKLAIEEEKFSNITKVGRPVFPREYSFVVKEGNDKLLQVVNAGIIRLKESGQYEKIRSSWFEKGQTKWPLEILVIVFAAIVILFFSILIWNRILRRKVKERTLELENECDQHKKTAEIVKLNEEKYRMVTENMLEIVATHKPDGTYIYINPAVTNLLGYSIEELIGTNPYNLVHPDDIESIKKKSHDIALQGNIIESMEYRIRKKNDEYKWFSTSTKPITNDEGEVVNLQTVSRDITERKRYELEMHELQTYSSALFEYAPIPIWVEDFSDVKKYFDSLKEKGVTDFSEYFYENMDEVKRISSLVRILDINQKNLEAYGVNSKQEFLTTLADWFNENSWNVFRDELIALAKGNNRFESEISIITPHNELKQLIVNISVHPNHLDTLQIVFASFIDITERKQAEKEKFDEYSKNQLILKTMMNGYLLADTTAKIRDVNPAYCKMVGYTRDELIKMTIFELEAVLTQVEIGEKIQQMIEDGSTRFETSHRHKDGRKINLDVSITILHMEQESLLAAIIHDITDRKRNEAALIENESKLRNIFEHSTNVFYSHDSNHMIHYFSPQVKDVLGYEVEEALIKWTELASDNPVNEIGFNKTVRAIETGIVQDPYELELIHKSGHKIWVEVREAPIVKKGKTVSIVGSLNDITESKKHKDELKKEHSRLIDLIENMSDAFVSLDRNWNYTYMNKKAGAIFNRNPADLIGKNIWKEFPEGVGQPFQRNYERAMYENISLQMEDYYPPYQKWFENRINPTEDGIAIFFTDITDRKNSEKMLLDHQKRLLIAQQSARLGFLDWDLLTNEIFLSDEVYEIYGLQPEQNFSTPEFIAKVVHPDDSSFVERNLNAALRGEQEYNIDHRIVRPDGKTIWVQAKAELIKDQSGKPITLLGTVLDITERKNAAIEVKRQQELLQKIFDNIPVMITYFDEAGNIRMGNNELVKILGYTLDEWKTGNTLAKCYPDPDVYKEVLDFMANKTAAWKDFSTTTKSGEVIFTSWTNIKLSEGSSIGIGQDINERKMAVERLIKSEARNKAMLEAIPDLVFLTDKDGVYLDYHSSKVESLYVNPDLFLGKNIKDILPEEFTALLLPLYAECVKTGETQKIEYALPIRGEVRYFDARLARCEDDKVLTISREITDNKKAQKELKNSFDQLRNLTAHLQSIREEERKTIAREIHDEFGQILSGLKMNLTMMSKEIAQKDDNISAAELINEFNSMNKIIDVSSASLKKLITMLRPEILDNLGFDSAVEWFLTEFENSTKITTQLEGSTENIGLSKELEITLFRILQESMTNVRKHSDATEVKVSFILSDKILTLDISDNGVGFQPNSIQTKGGYGLLGMKERALIFNGNVDIESKPGNGTLVRVSIPV